MLECLISISRNGTCSPAPELSPLLFNDETAVDGKKRRHTTTDNGQRSLTTSPKQSITRFGTVDDMSILTSQCFLDVRTLLNLPNLSAYFDPLGAIFAGGFAGCVINPSSKACSSSSSSIASVNFDFTPTIIFGSISWLGVKTSQLLLRLSGIVYYLRSSEMMRSMVEGQHAVGNHRE